MAPFFNHYVSFNVRSHRYLCSILFAVLGLVMHRYFISVVLLFFAISTEATYNTQLDAQAACYDSSSAAGPNYSGGFPCGSINLFPGTSYNYLVCHSDLYDDTGVFKIECSGSYAQVSHHSFDYIGSDCAAQGLAVNPDTGECESPPPDCSFGEYSPECAKDCPATGWSSAGSVGYGMLCPGDIPGAPPPDPGDTPPDIGGYGCISDAVVGACSEPPPGFGDSGDTSDDPSSDPNNGSFSGAGGGTGTGTGDAGSGSGSGEGGEGAADNSSDPYKAGGSPIEGEVSLYEYCLDNYYADSRCSDSFDLTPEPIDLCPNGGLVDPVIGCDYSAVDCPSGTFADSYHTCIAPPNTLTPSAPPPTGLPAAPEIGTNTRDTTTVQTNCDDTGNCTTTTITTEESGEPVSAVSGGATCNEPPSCSHSEDPVQCAILHQQWSTRCHAGEMVTANCDVQLECKADPASCAQLSLQHAQFCANADTTEVLNTIDSALSGSGLVSVESLEAEMIANGYERDKDVDLSDSLVDLNSIPTTSGTCPTDITIALGGSFGDITIDMAQFCTFFTWIGYLVRLAAALLSFNMIFSTIREI